MQRRNFIKHIGASTLLVGAGAFPFELLSRSKDIGHDIQRLTILHTNDVHSRIDPFPMDGGRNEGLAGVVRRGKLIDQIRAEGQPVLLLDAGDFFQGTPYFNMFGGEVEIKAMSNMKYDAATIGNHDFDAGTDGLEKQLKHANFPLLISNYDFSDTILNNKVLEHKIFEKDNIKIGVFGLGIELDGLVPKSLYKGTRYLDPVSMARKKSNFLRNEMGCHYVICLSHLGYKYKGENKIDDLSLAAMTDNIDLIIGGHTHTFLNKPEVVKNNAGKAVMINQVGFAGIRLGRIDLFFERSKPGRCESCENLLVG